MLKVMLFWGFCSKLQTANSIHWFNPFVILICILSVGCLFTVQKNPEVSPEGQKSSGVTPEVHENSKVNTKADAFELTQEKLGSFFIIVMHL